MINLHQNYVDNKASRNVAIICQRIYNLNWLRNLVLSEATATIAKPTEH